MGVINLTFYSQKLWHSDKPFPSSPFHRPALSEQVKKDKAIQDWLSTAYDVVNPEVISFVKKSPVTGVFRYWDGHEEVGKDFKDGDQITLPDGYGIEKHYQPDSGPLVRRVSIILPEKPDDIDMKDSFIEAFKKTIDAMTDEQLENELESVGDIGMQGPTITEYYDFLKSQFGVERDSNSAHGCPKCRTTDFNSCHSMYCPMRKESVVEPSESQEEIAEYLLTRWREIYKEEDIKYDEDYHDAADVNILMSRTLVRFVKELQEKFTITRK